ncbi:WSC domain containing protein [Ophiocordyceps camponoti-floridani]|uniref:WSC domain containing protein n=1 Tax=Ophiocordyceps camponoti-floridani TaxID=2030778 RepID=A0A8H4Q4P0_9HYPO|nr:WSC domain containing protein [Ophiocordyceps camponoti-floridani]
MRSSSLLLALAASSIADPTWPSPTDELEEIMYQLFSFGARKFADTVSPCSNEASGPGRQNAAEWLRAAFHDAATANTYFGTGGVDGSLQYELNSGENAGPGQRTTLEFMAPYVSSRASLADLIALGVYTSVRSCGGPAVPFRAGRRDAVAAGNLGVPQPQNSAFTFQQQFERIGFSKEEMIQVTACGHSIGGVHQLDFPDVVPQSGLRNGEAPSDSTVDKFDNKVVTEYLAGKTENPLVVGPAARINKNSDFKVFNSDGNKTVQAMADAHVFAATCKKVLQKMMDVVPPGVVLSDPVVPYAVKPVDLQLTLTDGGSTLAWRGRIRVRTNTDGAGDVKSISITYKDRSGSCPSSSSCTIHSTVQGVGRGFDDNFAFFPIEASIPASSGISSFVVTLRRADGSTALYDNNGKGYPLQDDIIFQAPQSCVLPSTGALTITAAVRNDMAANGARTQIWYREPQINSPVPRLSHVEVPLEKRRCVGDYTLFGAEYGIQGGLASQAYLDVLAGGGNGTDGFKRVAGFGGTCAEFERAVECRHGKMLTGRAVNETTAPVSTAPVSTAPVSTPPVTTAVVPPVAATHRPAVGGYRLVSCWTEGNKTRALSGLTFSNDTMTLDKCMEFCSKYNYWGTEYGRECYCGDSVSPSSDKAPLSDCNMPCGGNSSEYCGAGNRLELYSTTSAPTTPTPTATLTHKATVAASYTLVGCMAEPTSARALSHKTTLDGKATANEGCAAACGGSRYFGTEYGGECYCGSFVNGGTHPAPLTECNMPCGGDAYQYCGGSDRLELYENNNATGGTPRQPPTVADFTLVGCRTEGNGTRALSGRAAAADDMSNGKCAGFCGGATFFGTEYGRECYCGDGLDASSKVVPAEECGMVCAGDARQLCGAANRLSVYRRGGTPPVVPPPVL